MPTEFVMPKLGLTMEEGSISEWLVPDGAEVSPGTPVLRIETDKTETDVASPASGILHHGGAVGQTFACGERIGWFLAEGESAPASSASAPAAPTAPATPPAPAPRAAVPTAVPVRTDGRLFASPNARRLAAERGLDIHTIVGTGPNGRIVSEDLDGHHPSPKPAAAPAASASPSTAPTGSATWSSGSLTLATHAARQLADLLGVDIASIAPDRALGRVTRDGVATHVRSLLANPSPATVAPALQTPSEVIPLKGMRGTIAKRMHQSLSEMAQLSLFMDVDMDAVIADRARRKAVGPAPSYTDYVIAASARALQQHPRVNAQITEDGIALLPEVHVGVAVALDDGLMVPVVRNTLSHTLDSLAAETTRLAEAARSGGLSMDDLAGGTFSVSTLGIYGVDGFTPVINPPNAAILGVGRIRDELVANDDGSIRVARRMTVSLTWDHRVFDGVPAAEFTRTLAHLLTVPESLG